MIFGLICLIIALPIVALVDFLIDKYGLEEDWTIT